METHLAEWLKDTPDGIEAESILRKCVHCGFCTATCPTYQILGDELDSPRGRIYLIKQVVEGVEPTAATQLHLDRCLTCRNCETTCPSGVQYGRLIDIGRKLVDEKVERPLGQRLLREALKTGMTTRAAFEPAMKLGQLVRPLLPTSLKDKVPSKRAAGVTPTRTHQRKVLMLNGCVQPAMSPSIDAATARVLDQFDVQVLVVPRSGCCGAVKHHLNDHDGGLQDAKRNIDAWWPHIETNAVEAIVMNASGCGAMIKEYGHLLRDDVAYSAKATKISALCKDLIEYLPTLQLAQNLAQKVKHDSQKTKVAFHPPCTLQHGQQIKGVVESLLVQCGVDLQPVGDSHLCCGSAGTYSVLQPELSKELRKRKLDNLQANKPEIILSANIGCLTHLQSGTTTPVRHWIEWLDEVLIR
jgi:glycolate oxidase iron-sulfur subunit